MLQISCPGQEADDLAGLLCRALPGDWEIVLATGDTDWYQALRENVEWHSPTTGKHVTHADLGDVARIREGPFLSTDHYVRSKALAGDASDGIPGVPGVGLRTAARLLRDHGSVEDLWRRSDSGEAFAGVVLRRVAGTEYRDLYRRNLRLVDWRLAPPLAAGCSVDRGGGDPDGFARLCGAYRMGALSRQADRLAECAAGTRHVIAAIERALRGSPPPLPA
jgi:hypothetical protein